MKENIKRFQQQQCDGLGKLKRGSAHASLPREHLRPPRRGGKEGG